MSGPGSSGWQVHQVGASAACSVTQSEQTSGAGPGRARRQEQRQSVGRWGGFVAAFSFKLVDIICNL